MTWTTPFKQGLMRNNKFSDELKQKLFEYLEVSENLTFAQDKLLDTYKAPSFLLFACKALPCQFQIVKIRIKRKVLEKRIEAIAVIEAKNTNPA